GRDAERGEHAEHVAKLDGEAVVLRVPVVVREAAAAIVERVDAPRRLRIAAERAGEIVEILGGAGEAGQADHRQAGCKPRAVDTDVQLQAVRGDHSDAFAVVSPGVGRGAGLYSRRFHGGPASIGVVSAGEAGP